MQKLDWGVPSPLYRNCNSAPAEYRSAALHISRSAGSAHPALGIPRPRSLFPHNRTVLYPKNPAHGSVAETKKHLLAGLRSEGVPGAEAPHNPLRQRYGRTAGIPPQKIRPVSPSMPPHSAPHNPVNIFKQESPGRQLLQQSDILPKEPPSCIRGPRHTIGSSPRSTERLAGRPADNKINRAEFPSGQRPDIHAADPRMVKTPSRPSIQCECIAEFCLDLHRANDVKSDIRKTNIQAPRPRKQAQCSDLRDMAVFQPFLTAAPNLSGQAGELFSHPRQSQTALKVLL